MRIILALLGGLLIALVLMDMLWTTMGEGGGPLSKRIMDGLWKVAHFLYQRYQPNRLFSFVGIIILLLAVAFWILLLWAGWTLVFCGAEQAVLQAQTRVPAGFWDRAYFVGYTVSTLGVGNYVPQGRLWEILTAIAALSGLFLITFSITYLVPVVQAATQKRQLAAQISSLGKTADAILRCTWNGSDFQVLGQHLTSTLNTELAQLKQRHITYPVLHYFHSLHPTDAAALSIAALDEALTILEHGFDADGLLIDRGSFYPARRLITDFLGTLETAFIGAAEEPPPPPSLVALRQQGMPVVNDAVFHARLEKQAGRRRLLLALVENEGWAWDQVQSEERREEASPQASS